MTRQEISSLAIKFFAMYVFANILFTLPQALLTQTLVGQVLSKMGESKPELYIAWVIGGSVVIIGVILSVVLWRLSNSILSSTPSDNKTDSPSFSISELELIVIAGIGLFFTIDAISSLGYFGVKMFDLPRDELKTTSVVNFVFSLLQLLVAISLLVKPGWWSNLFRKTRKSLSSNTYEH